MSFLEDFKRDYDDISDYIDENRELMKEQGLDKEYEIAVFAWYLMNCHKTISKISYELCDLSKSTYDADTYISQIKEWQERRNNECIKDDLMAIIKDDLMDNDEKIQDIKEYLDGLVT